MIYADSSALTKLLVVEDETAGLRAWLSDHSRQRLVSSELALSEVMRACRRGDAVEVAHVLRFMASVDLVPVSRSVLETAGTAFETSVRSLDAIHLASALAVRDDLTSFVAYDRRLLATAEAAGLPTAAPA